MNITIKPKINASNRTKNRLREHGPEFIQELPNTFNVTNSDEILVMSVKDKWQGWLPVSELIIES